jgi:hypothetical protein
MDLRRTKATDRRPTKANEGASELRNHFHTSREARAGMFHVELWPDWNSGRRVSRGTLGGPDTIEITENMARVIAIANQ